MNVVFAGPTLHGVATGDYGAITFLPPARMGDIVAAVAGGAQVIGLIDGVFELMPSVWHKEILYALSRGAAVLGAASMGALRAAECHAFGMIGVGRVFEAYASGAIEDDEDVAQSHGPAELGYLPLSEPLVNISATLARLCGAGRITAAECEGLAISARSLFFKQRSYKRIVDAAPLPAERKAEILSFMKHEAVNVKRDDALLLLDMIEKGEFPSPRADTLNWRLAPTRSLQLLLQDNRNRRAANSGSAL
jgi:hypothetical protein